MAKYFSYIILSVFLLFSACGNNGKNSDNQKLLAEVFDYSLYMDEVNEVIPDGLSSQDSAQFVKNYIQQWVENKLILEKAKENISENFDKELEIYKNSLILYEYQKEIIGQLLDTVVSDEEAEAYYEKNKDNFLLKDNIVKVLYVKLEKQDKNIGKMASLLQRQSLSDKEALELENLVARSAVNYFLDTQKWLLFSDLVKEIPIETYNQENFLKNNRFIKIADNDYVYLVDIIDFKIKESVSPFSLEKERIREVILNKRKFEILSNLQKELLKEAENKGNVKIYTK